MTDASSVLVGLALVTLVVTLALGALWDARSREVPDRLWQVAGIIGAGLGAGILASRGVGAVLLWLWVAGFAVQHLFPWDERWPDGSSRVPDALEASLYLTTGLILLVTGWTYGLGAQGVPLAAVATFVAVVFARGLFEARILYGGADAKAVIAIAAVLPLWSMPLLNPSGALSALLQVTPLALNALVNAFVLSLVVPIGLALRNARRGEFSFRRGFLGSSIPTDELPSRFVWLPPLSSPPSAIGQELTTAAEDRQLRVDQAAALRARGVVRVWVTPQVPWVVFFALGTGFALLLGNILLDLIAAV